MEATQYCFMGRLINGVNDIASVDPDLASEWHPTKKSSVGCLRYIEKRE